MNFQPLLLALTALVCGALIIAPRASLEVCRSSGQSDAWARGIGMFGLLWVAVALISFNATRLGIASQPVKEALLVCRCYLGGGIVGFALASCLHSPADKHHASVNRLNQ
jgi:hypothetical protein